MPGAGRPACWHDAIVVITRPISNEADLNTAPTTLVLIAIAGGVGSVLRYLVGGWGQACLGALMPGLDARFPLGTLLVNVVGCGALGFLAALFASSTTWSIEVRMAVTVGLLGGFTTFSTFARETVALLADAQWGAALLNVLLSNVLGILVALVGYRIGERIYGVSG